MTRARHQDSTAVVTGGIAGIGKAVAQRLMAEGARVIVVDVDPDTEARARSMGAVGVSCDVASELGWVAVAAAASQLGGVDILVSNAVLQRPARLTDATVADWDAQFAVNVRGAFLGLKTFLPDLARQDGSAVLISSVHALVGLPAHPAYAATKAALTALTRQTAVDYAPTRVNCVLPGPVLTGAWDGVPEEARTRSIAQTPLGRFGRPDEVAAAVSFLASEEASFITGSSMIVDGGWSIVKDSA